MFLKVQELSGFGTVSEKRFCLSEFDGKLKMGRAINFWCDFWISNFSNFFVQDAKRPFYSRSSVADFVITGKWNIYKSKEYVCDVTIDQVTSIPLGCSNTKDQFVWLHNAHSAYTVRPSYQIALNIG